MNYIVYVTSSFNEPINQGNYRGEGRWERNVLDALLTTGKNVYIINKNAKWLLKEKSPTNLFDVSELPKNETSLFISNSPPNNIDIPVEATYYAIQWVNGPDDGAEHKFNKLKNAVATCLFYSMYKNFIKFYETELLPGPYVPYVNFQANNFKAKYLSVTARQFEMTMIYDKDQILNLYNYFNWIEQYLIQDKSLHFAIVCSLSGRKQKELNEWFWQHPSTKPLISVKNRVEIFEGLNWQDMLNLYSQTRLMVYPSHIGGPVCETSMFGIPPIIVKGELPFANKDGQNMVNPIAICNSSLPDQSFYDIADKLLNNYNMYKEYGDKVKEYVDKHMSYNGYINNLNNLCNKKGWI